METPRLGEAAKPASLPADDGMESLRQKMREIHNLAISTEEKARKMHLLMTRDYNALNKKTTQSEPEDAVPEVVQSTPTADNPYNVRPSDLEASYCPHPVPLCDEDDMPEDESRLALGCEHYSRNVKVQCFDCKLWFTCRHCHDTSPHLPFPHQLNRRKTENMLCMLCLTPQPAGEVCTNCSEETAYYYCSTCKLWDNDSTKRIYHCDDCGICRRGEGLGKDYVHCKRCNVCISISTSHTHPCVERATDCDCPLCLDYLFSSPQAVVSLLCGHYMHATCYKDLMRVTYRCPVCNKSAVNMELQWRKLDDEIRLQPMPEEDFEPLPATTSSRPASAIYPDSTDPTDASSSPTQRPSDMLTPMPSTPTPDTPAAAPPRRHVPRKVWIGCNDCGGRGYTPFHWLGLRCSICDGYNTTQTTPLGNTTTARSPVPGTYRLQRQHDFTGVDAIRSFGAGDGEGGAGGLDPVVREGEDRADSAYECSESSPARLAVQQRGLRVQETTDRDFSGTGRSYFFRAEQEEAAAAAAASGGSPGLLRPDRALSASASEMFGGVPYEMVMRLGRSLSPMRYYIEGLDLNGAGAGQDAVSTPPLTAAPAAEEKDKGGKGEEGSFWGSDGKFMGVWQSSSGDEGANDGQEAKDEGEDSEEEDDSEDDDDEESLDGGLDNEDDEDDDEGEYDLPGHM